MSEDASWRPRHRLQHAAAASGLGGFVDAVLEAVVDGCERKLLVNVRDNEGRTALHIAANRTVSFEPPTDMPNESINFQQIAQMGFEASVP